MSHIYYRSMSRTNEIHMHACMPHKLYTYNILFRQVFTPARMSFLQCEHKHGTLNWWWFKMSLIANKTIVSLVIARFVTRWEVFFFVSLYFKDTNPATIFKQKWSKTSLLLIWIRSLSKLYYKCNIVRGFLKLSLFRDDNPEWSIKLFLNILL